MKPKVLIIDDDRGIAKLGEFALHARGYDVQSAYDGRSGMAQACSDPPDLILLDYSLPGKDGIALLEDMRAIPDLEDTPVIMITGKGVKDLVQAALRYKICDFLVKPFEVSTLVDRVMKYLPLPES
jgi:DNA-binding response OmpR family regulator